MTMNSSATTRKAGIRRFRLIASATLFMLLPASSHAAEVLNAEDSGPGSFRQTVAEANVGETITFAGALSGSIITLTNGPVAIDKDLTIDASALAAGITLDGNGAGGILQFESGTSNALIGIRMINGNGGAVSLTNAVLTISGCILSGNSSALHGGGIFSASSSLTLVNCTLADNIASNAGGGIYHNLGTLSVFNSTLSGNSAVTAGGGIAVDGGFAVLYDTSLYENSAASGGGINISSNSSAALQRIALYNNDATLGGGVRQQNVLTLTNCTLYGNTADEGGGIHSAGTLTSQNSTIVGNTANIGGGIYRDTGPQTFGNTIISSNSAVSFANITAAFSGSGNMVNTININLAPLGSYGGPTPSMPPLPGSPAIDAGNSSITNTLSTDQNGFPRLSGAAVDVGAAEYLGTNSLSILWAYDWDGDGNPYGLEHALGLNPFVPDRGGVGSPPPSTAGVAFALNPEATNDTAWIVYRSPGLTNDFAEIYRFDGPSGLGITSSVPVSVSVVSNTMQVIDESDPLPEKAFYLLGVAPSP
jgi:hypothetical protein